MSARLQSSPSSPSETQVEVAPEEWERGRLRFIGRYQGGGTPAKSELAYWDGDIPWVSPKDMKSDRIADTEDHITQAGLLNSPCSIIPVDSLLFVVRSGILKHSLPVAINAVPVSVNQDLTALIPKSRYSTSFLAYLFRGCEEQFLSLWRKIGATVESIEHRFLADTYVRVPALPEQRRIAAYLDEETGKIDRLVELRRRQIELLKKQRASLIQQAVTRGLDPNIKLKDSGIPWIGKVPEHWEMTKLKFLSRTASGSTPNSSTLAYYEGGTIGWIRTTDLNGAELVESPVTITEAAVQDTACKIVPEGSVLIAMYGGAGTIGKHAILRFDSTVNQAVCAILPSKKISPDYLHAFVEFYRPYWMVEAEGGRKDPNIGQDDIKNLELPLPPDEEQSEIVDFLIRKRKEIDVLVGRLDDSIDLLGKYRASLINECVTGQRRVPA